MRSFAVAALFAALSTGALAAPLNTQTFTGDTAFGAASLGDKAVAEFRWGNNGSSGDWEVGLGFPTSSAGNFVQANNVWAGGETFKLNYDGLGGLALDFKGTTSFLTYGIDPTGFNALAVRADGRKGDVTISDLQFNGMGFGPLVGDDVVSLIAVTGLNLSDAWMLSGTINFSAVNDGPFTGNNNGSSPSFQVKLAELEVEAIPLPAAAWMLLTALGGLGLVGRRRSAAVA